MFLPYAQNIYDLRPYFPDFDAFLRTVDAWPVTCRVRIEDDVVLLEELLGSVTKVARWGRVNRYLLVSCHRSVVCSQLLVASE